MCVCTAQVVNRFMLYQRWSNGKVLVTSISKLAFDDEMRLVLQFIHMLSRIL